MLRKVFIVLGLVLIFSVLTYFFIFQQYKVVGSSMEPNVKDGEVYIVNKIAYKFSFPQREDVIIFNVSSRNFGPFVSRVIGLPGDTLKITQDGKVYVNGKLLDEPYAQGVTYVKGNGLLSNEQEVVVPENEYFALGDNRYHSSDSRQFGFVKRSDIVGKLVTCILNCK